MLGARTRYNKKKSLYSTMKKTHWFNKNCRNIHTFKFNKIHFFQPQIFSLYSLPNWTTLVCKFVSILHTYFTNSMFVRLIQLLTFKVNSITSGRAGCECPNYSTTHSKHTYLPPQYAKYASG